MHLRARISLKTKNFYKLLISSSLGLTLILHISKFKENAITTQQIIEHVLPVQTTEQDLILNELGLNVNIIGEFKNILLSNKIMVNQSELQIWSLQNLSFQ